MKKRNLIFLGALMFSMVSYGQNTDEVSILQNRLDNFYQKKLAFLKNTEGTMIFDSISISEKLASKPEINLLDELVVLFDPSNFKCGYDEKLKKKLKRVVNDKNTEGFVPSVVLNKIRNQKVSKLSDRGVNVAANSFRYESITTNSEPVFVRFSPTALNFNQEDYFERNSNTYSNFFYSLDCSGYLSNAISASGGIDNASLKAAANSSSNSNNSLVIVKGVMYSPLYLAYKGNGIFKSKTKEILEKRKEVLVQIYLSIVNDDRLDDTKIFLDTNYLLLLTSNSGKTSFNGEASLSAGGGIGFGFGNISAEGSASGKMNKTTEFNEYNTYILDVNVDMPPDSITVLSLIKIITEIEKELIILNKA